MLNKIRSIKILNIILGTLKKRIELKLLKYNKKIMKKLNIKDIDIKELDLENKNLDNDIIEYLTKIKFNELKVLNLEKNNISDIKGLEKINFTKLEKLNLKNNKICFKIFI